MEFDTEIRQCLVKDKFCRIIAILIRYVVSDENDYYSYNNIYDDHNEPNQRNTGLQKEEDINCGEHKYPYLLDDLQLN